MNPELINQVFQELGIENPAELLNNKETQADDVVSRIRECQRVFFQGQTEFVDQFKEVGRQAVLQDIYEKTAREFQLPSDMVVNKPIEDVLKLGISRIRENMSASEKKAEEMITSANRKAYDLENTTIPQIQQKYEKQISEIHTTHKIQSLIQDCIGELTHPMEVVYPFVVSQLMNKTKYSVSIQDNQIQILDSSNNVIRNKTKTEILTAKDVVKKILDEGKFLKTTPEQKREIMYQQPAQPLQTQQGNQFQQNQQLPQQFSFLPDALAKGLQPVERLKSLGR